MKSSHYEIAIVGAGLSGLVAAAAAASNGARVALIAAGPGSFVLRPGWLKQQEIAGRAFAQDWTGPLAFFSDLASQSGCLFGGDATEPRHLPSILGELARAAMAPKRFWSAEPRNGSRTAIVGIRGFSGFDENFMCERLREQARLLSIECAYTPHQIHLGRAFGVPVSLARIAECFDRDPRFRSELCAGLRSAASGADRIFIPGMLGLHSAESQIAAFELEVGCALCELPTLPPSIPSLRLFHRLSKYLGSGGAEFHRGFPVQQLEIQHGVCTSLTVATPGHPLTLSAKTVVLAAGRRSAHLLGPDFQSVDAQMRPLATDGSVIAQNLILAGSLMDSAPATRGDAADIFSGYRAGTLAAVEREAHAAR